jgi:hypothetical protein
MNRTFHRASTLVLAGWLASACTTMGAGTGATRTGADAFTFNWSSTDSVSGSMTATSAATGKAFTGRFFQITSDTRIDDLRPLWTGWGRRWGAWPYWGPDTSPTFVTHYSGRVVANLESADAQHMRCNFRLVRPASGLAGGGEGRCQAPDGKAIDATFPAK